MTPAPSVPAAVGAPCDFVLAGLLVLLLGASGCFLPALEAAPLALHASEAVGAGMLNAAAAHSDGRNDPDATDRCGALQLQPPMTVELRVDNNGPAAWREFTVGGPADAPRWQPLINRHSGDAGWRPVKNLRTMNFAPALDPLLRSGSANYLAYAPSAPQTSTEQAQLVALEGGFGGASGTFLWHGRSYQYTLVNKLPCFPSRSLKRR